MVSAHITRCLSSSGLDKYSHSFASLSDESFCAMLMQDYSKFGITDLEDKQRLFKLLKALNNDINRDRPLKIAAQQKQRPSNMHTSSDLLDLDDHDGDLLAHACGPALQMSPPVSREWSARSGPTAPAAQPVQIPQAQAPVAQYAAAEPILGEDVNPPKIRVVVRKRPLNRKEQDRGEEDVVEASMGSSYIIVNEVKQKVDLTKYTERHQFNFDVTLDESVSNEEVYQTTVAPLVGTLLRNGKASCFAYGQTGSGKTFTMSPLPIRAAADIFKYLAMPEHRDVTLHMSCFEIYGNKVFDLLNARKKLNILEDGKRNTVVVGLKEHAVTSVDLVKRLIEDSSTQRSTGSTAANADSSRSHSIMQFALKRPNPDAKNFGRGRALAGEAPPADLLVGKISFIDLAGSERGADTYDNNRQTRLEGAEINKSLLALKECIRALDGDARHVPFRGSKLTAVLKDSFIGAEARTVMIANISPASLSTEHSLNTLRYADRVKELRKDKADRAPGGVTPGEDPQYYASVARADVQEVQPAAPLLPPSAAFLRQTSVPAQAPASHEPLARQTSVGSRRSKTPTKMGMVNRVSGDQGPIGGRVVPAAAPPPPAAAVPPVPKHVDLDDGDDMMMRRDELMDTILEEEEQLITGHRMQIEETMELVRKEMALLTEVDQPGSAIDRYVEKLDGILQIKMDGIMKLKADLERFKEHLQQEEVMTASVRPGRRQW